MALDGIHSLLLSVGVTTYYVASSVATGLLKISPDLRSKK